MTNTVDEIRAKILFDVIKEPCGMDTILSTEDLCRDFKIGDGSVVNALKNINIEIEKGKLTILRGRSGSGKTTLINILGALDKPTKGKVMFGGRDITRLSERARDDIRRYKMAGGEQQRVAIARAIAHKPDIIFADEPTAELDTATALHVVKLFKELVARDEMTIIMTTHDPSMIDIADKVYTLEDGEIVE